MENNHLDNTFRYRLHDAEVPPPPFVWPSLARELKKRQRRRFAFWLFFTGLLTTAGIYTTWLLISSPKEHNKPIVPIAVSPQTPEARQTNEATKPTFNTQSELSPILPKKTATPLDQGKSSPSTTVFAPQPGHYTQEQAPSNTATETQALANQLLEQSSQAETAHIVAAKYPTENLPLGKFSFPTPLPTETPKPLPASQTFKAVGYPKNTNPPKLCYDFARHPSAWMLDAYWGPSLTQRTLSSNSDGNNYLKLRLSTERRSTAMGAGLRASLLFNQNYLVRTGLHYDQFTEIFEYIDPTYVKYKIEVTLVNGQTIIDTVGIEYGENYLKTFNRYGMLDVPLMLGVEMRNGRAGMSINAGFSANLLFFNRGAMLDPATLEPVRFGPNKVKPSQEIFRTDVGLSATASVQWYWHLTRHLRIFVEPSFRQVLRPITLQSSPVEQRYTIFGLRFGATHIF